MSKQNARSPLPRGSESLDGQMRHFLVRESGPAALRWRGLSEMEQVEAGKDALKGAWQESRDKMRGLQYGEVHKSRGDFRSLPFAKDLETSINMLMSMAAASKDPSAARINQLDRGLQNLVRFRQDFISGYKREDELTQALYANVVVALVKTTSRMTAAAVEFVKRGHGGLGGVLKPMGFAAEHFEDSLAKFNLYCESGRMDQYFSAAGRKGNMVAALAIGVATVAAVGLIVWLVREVIFQYFRTRVTIAEDLRGLSTMTQINASSIEATKPAAAKKQQALVGELADWADKIDVDRRVSEKDAGRDLASSDRALAASSPAASPASHSAASGSAGNLL
jgi:hypothetical protein